MTPATPRMNGMAVFNNMMNSEEIVWCGQCFQKLLYWMRVWADAVVPKTKGIPSLYTRQWSRDSQKLNAHRRILFRLWYHSQWISVKCLDEIDWWTPTSRPVLMIIVYHKGGRWELRLPSSSPRTFFLLADIFWIWRMRGSLPTG